MKIPSPLGAIRSILERLSLVTRNPADDRQWLQENRDQLIRTITNAKRTADEVCSHYDLDATQEPISTMLAKWELASAEYNRTHAGFEQTNEQNTPANTRHQNNLLARSINGLSVAASELLSCAMDTAIDQTTPERKNNLETMENLTFITTVLNRLHADRSSLNRRMPALGLRGGPLG